MRGAGFEPVYDRGQLLIDLALTLILGGEAISDFQGLRHLAPVIGPVPSTATVWRALAGGGPGQPGRVTPAGTPVRPWGGGGLGAPGGGVPRAAGGGPQLTPGPPGGLEAPGGVAA